MAVVGSPGARATATNRAVAPPSRGVLVALLIGPDGGGVGVSPLPGTHREERVQRGATSAPCAARDPHGCGRQPQAVRLPRPRSACTTGTCRCSKGLQGPLVRRTARHGGARPSRGWSPCVPLRSETLYVLLRPTQSRPTRSARAWWACMGRSFRCGHPGGWHPAERVNQTARCSRRGHPACLGDSPECVGRLRRVPGWPERENPISEAATGSPSAVSGACGARALPGCTTDVAQDPYPF